jgi:hypothetical protein
MSSESIDLMGVLRASQALSSESGVERLTVRVSEVLASLSGATKVTVLLSSANDSWLMVPAPGETWINLRRGGWPQARSKRCRPCPRGCASSP